MTTCPKCGKNEYGPGPFYDQFRWIGCYACGFGFKDMSKPKMFVVTRTPKGLDNILSVKPELASQFYCAVINVSDSQCATFDYQRAGVPSFWFPINEIGQWGHAPFYGALKVVNEYFNNLKPVLIHCHAGANRSPSIAYAIMLAKGYTPSEAEVSINYDNLREVFQRNIERKHIPKNIVEFLKEADKDQTTSLHAVLRELDALYDEWSQKKYDEQNDYTLKGESESNTRLVYNKEKKRFVIVKDQPEPAPVRREPWVEPIFERKEWNVTPLVPEKK